MLPLSRFMTVFVARYLNEKSNFWNLFFYPYCRTELGSYHSVGVQKHLDANFVRANIA